MTDPTSRVTEALQAAYPGLSREACEHITAELARILAEAIDGRRDLTQVQLQARGGKPIPPLAKALTELRKRAQLTRDQVAQAGDFSPSKLMRMELGQVKVKKADLMFLLDLYEADAATRARLCALLSEQ